MLLRILDSERERGFTDRAVAGGLAGFVDNLVAEDADGVLSPDVKALSEYDRMEVSDRADAVRRVLSKLAASGDAVDSRPGAKSSKSSGSGLDTPVTSLFRVGPQYQKMLEKLGIQTYRDVLFHFPRKYLDRGTFTPVADAKSGLSVNLIADVLEVAGRKSPRGRFALTEALLGDDSGSIRAIWGKSGGGRCASCVARLLRRRRAAHNDIHDRHPESNSPSRRVALAGRARDLTARAE